MQIKILILVALIGLTLALTTHSAKADKFAQWQSKFKIKIKNDKQHEYRKIIFNKKVDQIDKHNSKPGKSYKKGLNKFSHLTKDQFVKTYLGHKKVQSKASKNWVTHHLQIDVKTSHLQSGSDTVNWTSMGYTTEVKDQGACGSCWTFATTGALEGISAKNGNLQSFSEQQILDCTSNDYWGNWGCDGGSPQMGIIYAAVNGVVTESTYPYQAVQGDCLMDSGPFKISNYKTITACCSLNEEIMSNPVAITVMASNWGDYESGIFNECDKEWINHAVLLTGKTSDAYIVKNSWGTEWGELGYIRLTLGDCCGVCGWGLSPIA